MEIEGSLLLDWRLMVSRITKARILVNGGSVASRIRALQAHIFSIANAFPRLDFSRLSGNPALQFRVR